MTINYIIDQKDLLTYQLFIASKSERIKKQRQRNKIMGLFYLPMGLVFFLTKVYPVAIVFFVIGSLWAFLYPRWEKKKYIKNYQGFINENQKERIGRPVTLEINEEFILTKDNVNESKIQLTELEGITEISSVILMKLKGGLAFVIPKQGITNLQDLVTDLKELASRLSINYEADPNWEWK